MNNRRKRRKPATITRKEALRRIEAMIKTIHFDVHMALWDEAVIETGNIILRNMSDKNIYGASAYTVIHQGLAAHLSMTLTRLYDFGSKRYQINKRETSSIPMLINLVRQKRCADFFVDNVRNWTSAYQRSDNNALACENALKKAIDAYRTLMTSYGPSSLKRMQIFRNYRIAHRKFDDVDRGFPFYRDLFRLIGPAVTIIENLQFATKGLNLDLAEQKLTMAEEAEAFWSRALHPISN